MKAKRKTKTIRIRDLDLNYLRALNSTLTEWESEEDEQAYNNLKDQQNDCFQNSYS